MRLFSRRQEQGKRRSVVPTAGASLTPEQQLGFFKFYEDAAQQTKAHAWTLTTWVLTLNTGVLGFSVNLSLAVPKPLGFLMIETFAATVGLLLCAFVLVVLAELGSHIAGYWTNANRIAAAYPPLRPFVGEEEAVKASDPCYRADFPRFCWRLQVLAVMFLFAHLAWLAYAVLLFV